MKNSILDTIKSRTTYKGECWCYTSSVNSTTGYADMIIDGKLYGIHRLSAAIFLGLDLDDSALFALHKAECKYLNCWNPEHIYVGTHADNMRDLGERIRNSPCRKCGSLRRYKYRVSKTGRYVSYCLDCKRKRHVSVK